MRRTSTLRRALLALTGLAARPVAGEPLKPRLQDREATGRALAGRRQDEHRGRAAVPALVPQPARLDGAAAHPRRDVRQDLLGLAAAALLLRPCGARRRLLHARRRPAPHRRVSRPASTLVDFASNAFVLHQWVGALSRAVARQRVRRVVTSAFPRLGACHREAGTYRDIDALMLTGFLRSLGAGAWRRSAARCPAARIRSSPARSLSRATARPGRARRRLLLAAGRRPGRGRTRRRSRSRCRPASSPA